MRACPTAASFANLTVQPPMQRTQNDIINASSLPMTGQAKAPQNINIPTPTNQSSTTSIEFQPQNRIVPTPSNNRSGQRIFGKMNSFKDPDNRMFDNSQKSVPRSRSFLHSTYRPQCFSEEEKRLFE